MIALAASPTASVRDRAVDLLDAAYSHHRQPRGRGTMVHADAWDYRDWEIKADDAVTDAADEIGASLTPQEREAAVDWLTDPRTVNEIKARFA